MGFLTFPFDFADDDYEEKEACNLPVKKTRGEITINTNHIIAYNKMDNGNTLTRMSNGEAYELPVSVEEFENLLSEVDMIYDLNKLIKDN